jgi:hypothetical protein
MPKDPFIRDKFAQ